MITAFTDGSSLGNPGPGGWGAIVNDGKGSILELGGRENRTTNNRMELEAVRAVLAHVGTTPRPVEIRTDSSYVANGITKWIAGWKRNGWMTSTKSPVANRDLWEAIDSLVTARAKGTTTFVPVKAHVGIPGNERADSIAVAFAENKKPTLYVGPVSEYAIDLMAETPDPKKSSNSRKGKAYSYLSLVDGVLGRHATWEECKARVEGKRATRFRKALSKDEEDTIIREWGCGARKE
jgi:ribonuclease HI